MYQDILYETRWGTSVSIVARRAAIRGLGPRRAQNPFCATQKEEKDKKRTCNGTVANRGRNWLHQTGKHCRRGVNHVSFVPRSTAPSGLLR